MLHNINFSSLQQLLRIILVNTGPPAFKNIFLRNILMFQRRYMLLKTLILLGKSSAWGGFIVCQSVLDIAGASSALLGIEGCPGHGLHWSLLEILNSILTIKKMKLQFKVSPKRNLQTWWFYCRILQCY